MLTTTFRSIIGLVLGASFLLEMAIVSAVSAQSPAFNFYMDYLKQTVAAEKIEDIGKFMPDW